ncbi:MAG: MATE family efflux transporter [Flexilinea sp.]|nr:MATE family efflux transporter [Flexilinea sp.]
MNIQKITNDSTYRRIAQLTLPIVLQNLLTAAVSSTDAIMLNFVGQAHISAVSLAAQYASILFNILYGLGTGISMLGAQYYGKGDLKTVEAVEGIALRFSVPISLLFGSGAFFFPEVMMRVFTPEPELIGIGARYLRILSVSYLCWGILEIYLSTLRSIGRVTICMVLNVTAFSLNIFLNAVFIFGLFGAPKLGAAGVALATTISRVAELILVLIVSARSRDIKLRPSLMFVKNRLLFRDFLSMALPALGNDISWSLAFSLYSVIIGQFLGSDMVAANSFATMVRHFGVVLSSGLASAGGILVGQMIGSGRMKEAEETAGKFVKLTVLSGLVGGAAVLTAMPFVLRFADITQTGKEYLRVMLFINSYYIMGIAINTTLIGGIFRAGGDSRFGLIVDTIDMWCFAVPLGFFSAAVLKLPPLWVYFLLCTDEFVKWPWVIGHYKSRKWLKNITRQF